MSGIAEVIIGQQFVFTNIKRLVTSTFVSCFVANSSLVVSVVVQLDPDELILQSIHPP